MRRLGWLATSLLYGACLYDVGEVASGSETGGVGGSNEAGDVAAEGWVVGGSGGQPPDVVESAVDVQGDVSDAMDANDATSDVTDGASDAPTDALGDGSPTTWSSCKSLGYAGACFGDNTILFFDAPTCGSTNHCWVNNCSLKGGQCTKLSGSCGGTGCTTKLDAGQVEDCTNWGAGQCRNNAAIKADPTDGKNCLYRNCTALGLACAKPASGVDCF